MTEQNIELIQLGSLLFLSAYHIILFFQVRRFHYLYLGLLGLLILIRATLVSDGSGLMYSLIPSLSHITGHRIEGHMAYGVLVVAPMFFNDLYRYKSLEKYVRFFQLEGLLFFVVDLFIPNDSYKLFYLLTHNIFNISALGSIVLMVVIVARAMKEKKIGSKYIFCGLAICSVFAIGEVLKKSGWAPNFETQGPNLLNSGILLLFFFQSIALSAIYANSFKENELLNLGLEERVSSRTEQLSKSNLIRERFIKIMSHDFRAPMISLKSMLSLVVSNSISKQQSIELSKQIGVSLDRSLNMLDDLLEWSKASSESKVKIFKENIDLKKMISEVISFYEEIALIKSIQLKFKPGKHKRILVESDTNSTKVVVRNLVSNAIKFTENGGIIEVGFMKKGRTVEIFVADNGIGVPDTMKESIFEMESENRRVGTNNEKSTGVGLALCKDLVNQNGGKIWLEDNSPNGTIFIFTLNLSS